MAAKRRRARAVRKFPPAAQASAAAVAEWGAAPPSPATREVQDPFRTGAPAGVAATAVSDSVVAVPEASARQAAAATTLAVRIRGHPGACPAP